MLWSLLLVNLILQPLLAGIAPWVVFAATQTFNGTNATGCPAGSPWSTTGCWNTGAGPVPSNGDDVVLSPSSVGSVPNNCDIGRTLNSITFSNTTIASTVGNAGGCSLGLQSGGFITDSNTNVDQINTGLALNGPATFTLSSGASGLSFGGPR